MRDRFALLGVNFRLSKPIFDKEKHRIVFWYDGGQEFAGTLPELGMEDINVLRLDEYSPLEIKICLEIQVPRAWDDIRKMDVL